MLRQIETKHFFYTVTFLSVLSSCHHEDLVEEGRQCFNLMLANGLRPELDQNSCNVNLLNPTGLLEEALGFVEKIHILANAVI